jgi:iron complex transport system substrate-binding protein
VGYHRALSAEGILSLKSTLVMHDNNVGPPPVLEQLAQLNIPTRVFNAKGDTIDGTKAPMREMGSYFHKETRAEELCHRLDRDMTTADATMRQYPDHPKVVILHFGRASDVYLTMRSESIGGKMVEWAGGRMAVLGSGSQQLTSPEIVAQANPDVIIVTDFGYDRLGSSSQIKDLPGVAATNAARNNRLYRVDENDIIYLGPRTGENIVKIARLIRQGE